MTVSPSAQRDATLTPRLKSALLWGVVGALCFLVLHQGYLLLDGEFLGVRPVAAVAVGVFVVTVVASYFTAGQLEMFQPDVAAVDVPEGEQSGPGSASRSGSEPERVPESEGESTPEPETAPEPPSQPATATVSESGSEPEPERQPAAEPDPEPQSDPESEPEPEPEPEPDPGPVADGSVGQGIAETESAGDDDDEGMDEDEWIWGEENADG